MTVKPRHLRFSSAEKSVVSQYCKEIVHLRARRLNKRLGIVFGAQSGQSFGLVPKEELIRDIARHQRVRGQHLLSSETAKQSISVLLGHFTDKQSSYYRALATTKGWPYQVIERRVRGDWLEIIRELAYQNIRDLTAADLVQKHPYISDMLPIICDAKFVVNTGFDSCLAMVLEYNHKKNDKRGRGYEVIFEQPIPVNGRFLSLIHPNGFLPRDQLGSTSNTVLLSEEEAGDYQSELGAGRFSSIQHFFNNDTCLIFGLSDQDQGIRYLLRQNANHNPGNIHYCVEQAKDPDHVDKDEVSAIVNYRLKNQNLVTLRLNNEQIVALARVLSLDSENFCELAAQVGKPTRYVYYISGVPGVGKSSTIRALRNFETLEEWPDEPLPELARDPSTLTKHELLMLDDWVARQFGIKNSLISSAREGIFVVDRPPLDPLAFTPRQKWKTKAELLKTTILKISRTPVENGCIVLLEAEPDAILMRRIIKKTDYNTKARLSEKAKTHKHVYKYNMSLSLDTTLMDPKMVTKEIMNFIMDKTYSPVDIRGILDFLAGGGENEQ